jgi:hypothetical protein
MKISLLLSIATLMTRSAGVVSLELAASVPQTDRAQSTAATPESSEWNATTTEAAGVSQEESVEGEYHDGEGIESTTETAHGGSGDVKDGTKTAGLEHGPRSEEEGRADNYGSENDAAVNARADWLDLKVTWLWRVGAPVVSVLGVFGNAMIFVLMQRVLGRNMQAFGVLFTALAFFDTLSLSVMTIY